MSKNEKTFIGLWILGILGIIAEIGEGSLSGIAFFLIMTVGSALLFFLCRFIRKHSKVNESNNIIEVFVNGTYYRNQKEISKLMELNTASNFKYKKLTTNAVLVEEPTNIHDKNAIKVLISGVHVGYIPAEECIKFKSLIHSNRISEVIAEISGGPRKDLSGGYDNTSFRVNLTVITK